MAFQVRDYLYSKHGKGDHDVIFQASDMDEATSTRYYGYLAENGAWMIMKNTETYSRYCMGSSDYTTNWTGRAGLTYVYYNQLFA